MPIEDILGVLDQHGVDEVKELQVQAELQASEIIERATREADEIRKRSVMSKMKAIGGESSRIVTEAKLKVRRQTIVAKDKMIDSVFEKAAEDLGTLRDSPEYPKVLKQLLDEILEFGLSKEFVVNVDPKDKRLASNIIKDLDIECQIDTNINCCGGAKATSLDGRINFNNTLESRLDRARQFIRPEVTKILFGE